MFLAFFEFTKFPSQQLKLLSRWSSHPWLFFLCWNTNFLNHKLRLQIHNSVENKFSQILKQTAPLFFSPELLKGSFGLPMILDFAGKAQCNKEKVRRSDCKVITVKLTTHSSDDKLHLSYKVWLSSWGPAIALAMAKVRYTGANRAHLVSLTVNKVEMIERSCWADNLQLSSHTAAELTHHTDCNQTNKSVSSWANTVELTSRRTSIQYTDHSSTNSLHLTWQSTRELKGAVGSQADKLQLSCKRGLKKCTVWLPIGTKVNWYVQVWVTS